MNATPDIAAMVRALHENRGKLHRLAVRPWYDEETEEFMGYEVSYTVAVCSNLLAGSYYVSEDLADDLGGMVTRANANQMFEEYVDNQVVRSVAEKLTEAEKEEK